MASVLLLAVVIMLEAPAVAAEIRAEQIGFDAPWDAELLLPVLMAVVLCVAATILPLRLALVRMRRFEF
jgi:hypothetical protein